MNHLGARASNGGHATLAYTYFKSFTLARWGAAPRGDSAPLCVYLANINVEGKIMGKVLILLFLFLSTMGSVAGYLYLDKMISAGKIQISEGQAKLEKGQSAMKSGQAELDAGKKELSEGKEEYAQAEKNFFLVLADNLFKGGKGFEEGRERIAEGGRQVAKGEREIDRGERRLDAGEQKLTLGREQLQLARKVRLASAIGAVVFASLTIVFGFYWRRALIRLFKRPDA